MHEVRIVPACEAPFGSHAALVGWLALEHGEDEALDGGKVGCAVAVADATRVLVQADVV